MKEIFKKCYKKGVTEFIKNYKREPNADELQAIRTAARVSTAIYLIATGKTGAAI